MATQAAATRLVYSFARDGVIAGRRVLAKLHPTFHMPPGAIAFTAIIPAAIAFLPSATVTRITTFAVVGIYVGFQAVVLAAIIARARGWRPAGSFTLGRWGWDTCSSAVPRRTSPTTPAPRPDVDTVNGPLRA